jgi:hypothetical protein
LATKSILKRGFKAQAERQAVEFREFLGLKPVDPLCAFDLANHLGIEVFTATEIFGSDQYDYLLSAKGENDCGWSALTMEASSGSTIIIHNSFHAAVRQQSNIMHELAHIICEHSLSGLTHNVPLPIGMRQFDRLQEEEAICLGSTLQITKPGLMWAIGRNMTNQQIAEHFNASEDMVVYRKRISGAERHAYNRRRYARV